MHHSPVVRRILPRAALFLVPGSCLWALLPLIATRQLALGPGGYGVLLGALGVGAIAGPFVLPQKEHLRQHDERQTGTDLQYHDAAAALSDPRPHTDHYLTADVVQ